MSLKKQCFPLCCYSTLEDSALSTQHTHYAPLNRFTTSPPELWMPTLIIIFFFFCFRPYYIHILLYPYLIVSISYCIHILLYHNPEVFCSFGLSDFRTHLVPEVDNIARRDVSFNARGIQSPKSSPQASPKSSPKSSSVQSPVQFKVQLFTIPLTVEVLQP